jgi:hypothetical protein
MPRPTVGQRGPPNRNTPIPALQRTGVATFKGTLI